MRRKNLNGVLAACMSFSMVVSGFSASAINVSTAKAEEVSDKTVLTDILTPDDITLREKWEDKSNIGEERKVTIKGTGTEMTIKDNGTMRTELSSQDLANEHMGAGINLGNTMEAVMPLEETETVKNTKYTATVKDCETVWKQPITTQAYIDKVHSYGINTLRIPVAWSNADKDDGTYKISDEYLGRVEEIVNYALNNGMYVVINDHWDNQWWGQFGACKYQETEDEDGDLVKEYVMTKDENGEEIPAPDEELRAKAWARYEAYWTQIAERFKGYSDHLIFEGANEELGDRLVDAIGKSGYAVGNDSTEQALGGYMTEDELYETANKINQKFVDIIRKSGDNNKYRHLLIPGYNTDIAKTVDEVKEVKEKVNGETVTKKVGNRYVMPTDIEENGKTKLFLSVHYYTPWDFCGDGGTGTYTVGDQKATAKYFASLKKFSDEGYGIIIGECGICNPAGVESSVTQWLNDTFTEAQKISAVPVLWDTGAYFDRKAPAMCYKDIADFYNTINGTSGDASMTAQSGGKPDPSASDNLHQPGAYIDQDLWNTKGIHAYLYFQTSTWDYRNNYKPFSKAGKDKTYEYIQASGKEAPETAKANDVLLTKDGEYTVSIDGAAISGTKYQMLGLAMDLLVESYPGVKITNTSITVDGKNIMQSPKNPNPEAIDLYQKQDDKYYTFVAINTWDSEKENTDEKYPMSARNEKGKLKTPKKSISMTFTVTGLEKALKDIENKTYVDPQTGKTLQQEEEEAAATPVPTTAPTQAPTKAPAQTPTASAVAVVTSAPAVTSVAAKGDVVKDKNASYKVTDTTKKTVEYKAPASKAKKSVVIPATVKVEGTTYKVTSIAKNAFKNNKKIKKVTISSNITSIGANAFSGCKSLKNIVIKSTKLKSVGKNALKGINKKAVIKVPAKKLKAYKKLFTKKTGFKKTMKIKK